MRANVTAISVYLVYDFDIARNFALDSLIGPVFHLTQGFLLFRTHLHISYRASNQLNFLELIESLIHKRVLIARAQAFSLSFFAGLELDPAQVIIHRLLLLKQMLCPISDHILDFI